MKRQTSTHLRLGLIGLGAVALGLTAGCGTQEVRPMEPLPEVPGFVQVPYPETYDIGDLNALFIRKEAPVAKDLENCDENFKKLQTATNSKEEVFKGARELVQQDAVKYHWCFFHKIRKLQERLSQSFYVEERQKAVLETFDFLTPISRAFRAEYKDPRYLRWAIKQYRMISEYVFYRRVLVGPAMSKELVEEVQNPFSLARRDEEQGSVLDKYAIMEPKRLAEIELAKKKEAEAKAKEEKEKAFAMDFDAPAPPESTPAPGVPTSGPANAAMNTAETPAAPALPPPPGGEAEKSLGVGEKAAAIVPPAPSRAPAGAKPPVKSNKEAAPAEPTFQQVF